MRVRLVAVPGNRARRRRWAAIETGLIQAKVATVRAEREKGRSLAPKSAAHRHQRVPRHRRSHRRGTRALPFFSLPLFSLPPRWGRVGVGGREALAPQCPIARPPPPIPPHKEEGRLPRSRHCRVGASRSRSKHCAMLPTGRLAQTGARPKIFLANLGRLS